MVRSGSSKVSFKVNSMRYLSLTLTENMPFLSPVNASNRKELIGKSASLDEAHLR